MKLPNMGYAFEDGWVGSFEEERGEGNPTPRDLSDGKGLKESY